MRNPFRKQDENVRPVVSSVNPGLDPLSKDENPRPIDVQESEPVEYKLSEINDSGVYLPPSPIERRSFWGTTSSRSTTSSSIKRSIYDENEPFNMSRESFDSYRRSFDISARSPVIPSMDGRQRSSLDSRTFLPPPRSSNSFHRPLQVPDTQTEEEDRFEDVNIDEPKAQQAPKKRGIFARMVDGGHDNSSPAADSNGRPSSSSEKSTWHPFGNRKRGQSGQGAELGTMPLPQRDATPKPEKQQAPQLQAQQPAQSQFRPPPVSLPAPSQAQSLAPPPAGLSERSLNTQGFVPAPKPEKSAQAVKSSTSSVSES